MCGFDLAHHVSSGIGSKDPPIYVGKDTLSVPAIGRAMYEGYFPIWCVRSKTRVRSGELYPAASHCGGVH